MRVLAFDTSLSGCSAAFFDGKKCVYEIEPMERGQAEHLVPMIGRVLNMAGADFADIERIATTVGPGAFTGLRIGLSTARALGLALNVPVDGVGTFDAMAQKFMKENDPQPEEGVCILVETRRMDFYVRFPDGAMESMAASAIERRLAGKKAVFIGDALRRFRELCPSCAGWRFAEGYERPDPCLMAEMAAAGAAMLPPEPLYLRGADVSQPKKGRTIIFDAIQ